MPSKIDLLHVLLLQEATLTAYYNLYVEIMMSTLS